MRSQFIMFLGLIFAVGTIISLSYAGVGLGSDEVDFINSIAVFKQASILGIWSVPVPNITFFFTGMRSLINMDFAFFNDGMAIVQFILYAVFGLGVMWGIFTIIIAAISSIFSRATR